MPVYEYECDLCIDEYNKDISTLVEKLNKTNAARIMKKNSGFRFIEVYDDKKDKLMFSLGEKGKSNSRRYRYNLKRDKTLYLELTNYKFSELIYNKDEEESLICPCCSKGGKVRRVFSTFKAIFDKRDRAPRPGDELAWHLDYKKMKDEEMASSWVGADHLNQYFND